MRGGRLIKLLEYREERGNGSVCSRRFGGVGFANVPGNIPASEIADDVPGDRSE